MVLLRNSKPGAVLPETSNWKELFSSRPMPSSSMDNNSFDVYPRDPAWIKINARRHHPCFSACRSQGEQNCLR